ESRAGTLGTMLELTEALEGDDGQACHGLTAQLAGLNAGIVNACLSQALVWANNIGKEHE
ncbi:MAG TPA: diguanylate phosphodiesterase, partial [Rhodocyclaceae bacterium]|nr:diguanylate phosphodiesterase [Rhodocyclaceae bacterium]